MVRFPAPSIVWRPAWGDPIEFIDETYQAKTRGMGLTYGEIVIILTSTVFANPPVWQIDGRTDDSIIAG